MTALEYWKARADAITEAQKQAISEGRDTISYTDHNGKPHTMYYHSGRWNDRPSRVGAYRGI